MKIPEISLTPGELEELIKQELFVFAIRQSEKGDPLPTPDLRKEAAERATEVVLEILGYDQRMKSFEEPF